MGLIRRHGGAKPTGEPASPLPGAPGTAAPVAAGPDRAPSRPRRLKLRIAAFATLALGLGAMLWLGVMMVYYTIMFPDPLSVRGKEAAPVIRILARDGTLMARRGAAHDYMSIAMIPAHVVDAVVATEDRRFFEHLGIDPVGMLRAAFANLRAGRFAQGGSTLTQQLAKNLFLTSERTLSRKVDELALAFWLEVRLSKREILELYLNRVYFGGGAYGIEAAAQRYFDKSVRALTVAEAALIAGLLKAPSKYAPTSSPQQAIARTHTVLARMRSAGVIDEAAYENARQERLHFAALKEHHGATGFEYAIDLVLEKLPPILGSEYSEMIVETTIDAALQRSASAAVNAVLDGRGKAKNASQAALITIDQDGGIRSLVGGRSYAESQFNRATKAKRQPGSVFKPFVYLAALERGMKPDTITYDLPLTIDGWSPRNDSNTYAGALTLRQALSQSVNTVAVRLATDIGLAAVARTARRLGVQSDLREDASMALGTSEMTLLELVGAYGSFANSGWLVEPHIIRRVRLNTGRVLYARGAPAQRRVVGPVEVGALNDMLNSTLVTGTGRRAALKRHPAAGKTGTTQDFRDAWFVGYTAYMTTGVWIGNDDGTPMRAVTGGNLPAQIWRAVMQEAHAGLSPEALPGTAPIDAETEPGEAVPVARSSTQEQPLTIVSRPADANSLVKRPQSPAPSPAPALANAERSGPAFGQRLIIEPPRVAAQPVKRSPPPSPAQFPSERISDDFLARVLEPPSPAGNAVAEAASEFDAETIRQQLDALPEETASRPPPPRGMMSLGAAR